MTAAGNVTSLHTVAVPAKPVLAVAALAVILAIVSYRLFAGITTRGMAGVDTFEYWKYAYEILHGQHDFVFDRLAFYAINVAALKVLGLNDYAIRAATACLDLLNIVLVWLLSFLISRSFLIGVAVAALYGFNPVALKYAALELPHISSATFVLLGTLAAVLTSDSTVPRHIRQIATVVVGVAAVDAVLTHEDLVFLAGGLFFALIAMDLLSTGSLTTRIRAVLVTTLLFAIGGGFGALWPMLTTGVWPGKIVADFFLLRAAVDQNTAIRTGGDFFAVVWPRFLNNLTIETMGPVLAVLAGVVAVIVPARFCRGGDGRLRPLLVLEIVLLVYLLGFLLIGRVYLEGSYARLLVPLLGPALSFALCGGYLLLRPVGSTASMLAITAITGYALVAIAPWSYVEPPASLHRMVYAAIKDRVNEQAKLLLPACFGLDADFVGLGSAVYLGDRVVPIYLIDKIDSFDSLIAQTHVRYVLIVTQYRLRGMWPRREIEQLFSVTYGMPSGAVFNALPKVNQQVFRGDKRVEWTVEACKLETNTLRSLMTRRGARLVATVSDWGQIYELPH